MMLQRKEKRYGVRNSIVLDHCPSMVLQVRRPRTVRRDQQLTLDTSAPDQMPPASAGTRLAYAVRARRPAKRNALRLATDCVSNSHVNNISHRRSLDARPLKSHGPIVLHQAIDATSARLELGLRVDALWINQLVDAERCHNSPRKRPRRIRLLCSAERTPTGPWDTARPAPVLQTPSAVCAESALTPEPGSSAPTPAQSARLDGEKRISTHKHRVGRARRTGSHTRLHSV